MVMAGRTRRLLLAGLGWAVLAWWGLRQDERGYESPFFGGTM